MLAEIEEYSDALGEVMRQEGRDGDEVWLFIAEEADDFLPELPEEEGGL